MAVGRWVLLALMVLAAPLLWWAGVAGTASAALAARPPGDESLPSFVASYRSGGLVMTAVFALLNLWLVLGLLPAARRLREGRTGTIVRVIVATVLLTGLAWAPRRRRRSAEADEASPVHFGIRGRCWRGSRRRRSERAPAGP
ncbi:hypothetical protein AB0F81_06530 [Actinoplanes sp. NPDC024001]|uniref:hypothetical protein n=1 Tax=Actinoplanes sp. NPDC024001 TaxID=3154598 RepID=UPI0033E01A95